MTNSNVRKAVSKITYRISQVLGEVMALTGDQKAGRKQSTTSSSSSLWTTDFSCSLPSVLQMQTAISTADLLSLQGSRLTGPSQSLHYFLAQLFTLSWLHLHVPLRIPGEVPLLPAWAGQWSVSDRGELYPGSFSCGTNRTHALETSQTAFLSLGDVCCKFQASVVSSRL